MKKILFLTALLSGVTLLLHASDGYIIKGKITGNYGGYIYLSYQDVKDSALVQNNTFEFTGKLDKPVLAWMNLQPFANVSWLYIENSTIVVEGDFSTTIREKEVINLYRITSISGSHSQDLWDHYKEFCNENQNRENFNELRFKELKLMFTKNPTIPVNGWILGDLAVNRPVFTYEEFLELYSLLDTVSMQRNDMRIIHTGFRTMNKYGVGQPFPTFELSNHHGDVINSSRFSKKVVLIDFWASWCGPCRVKHPVLIELQKKYQNKNFNLVSISIDKDKDAWHKAILKDNLTWDNLIDVDSKILNELGIQSIPFIYLLDEHGNIVSVNQSLEKIDLLLQEKLK
jgi:thiol-disulfide isomerase/thioredoxin